MLFLVVVLVNSQISGWHYIASIRNIYQTCQGMVFSKVSEMYKNWASYAGSKQNRNRDESAIYTGVLWFVLKFFFSGIARGYFIYFFLFTIFFLIEGFTNSSNRCVPVCKACIHGKCVAPDQCRCEAGFSGPACDICMYNSFEFIRLPK